MTARWPLDNDDDDTDPGLIPIFDTVDIVAEFGDPNDESTPTLVSPAGACWKCETVKPRTIVAEPPGSIHDVLRYSTCVLSLDETWAVCAARLFVRFGVFDLFLGHDRRVAKLPPHDGWDRRK